jgi:hypothetical protein
LIAWRDPPTTNIFVAGERLLVAQLRVRRHTQFRVIAGGKYCRSHRLPSVREVSFEMTGLVHVSLDIIDKLAEAPVRNGRADPYRGAAPAIVG